LNTKKNNKPDSFVHQMANRAKSAPLKSPPLNQHRILNVAKSAPLRTHQQSLASKEENAEKNDVHNHDGPGLAGNSAAKTTRILMLLVAIVAGIGIVVGIILIFLFVIPAFTTHTAPTTTREWQEDPEAGIGPPLAVGGLQMVPHGVAA
jgi:hypothetical protein